jgi:hypothetical protein
MLALGRTILLVSMMAGNMERNPCSAEERVEFLILPSPIRLNSENFVVEHMFNKLVKFKKILENLRFMAKQINPGKYTVIINKAHIIFLATKRIKSRTLYIRKHKF